MLQKTSKWCPNPDKVFISPTGQLVGTETVTTPQLDNQQDPDAASTTAPGQQYKQQYLIVVGIRLL